MQTLKQIIVINLTIFPLISSTFIKPAGELSHYLKKQDEALEHALKDNDARKAFKNYSNSIKFYRPRLQEQTLNYAATIISAPDLSQEEKEYIAAWASEKLFRQKKANRKYATWKHIAVDLMRRMYDIQNEQINKSFKDYLATKQDTQNQQNTIKVNILDKIKKNEQFSIGIENLTSYQFSLEEKTLLTEHFTILQLQNKVPRLTIQQNEFTTFNDLDELERQVHQERLTNTKQIFLEKLEQQGIAHSAN